MNHAQTLRLNAFVATVAVLATFPLSALAQNLIVNGSFEMPGGVFGLPNGSTDVTGWVSVNNTPNAPAANHYNRAPYDGHPTSDGDQFIYIDNNSHPSPSLNGIYQDIPTVPGRSYKVSFDAATEVSFGIPGLLKVSAGNMTLHYTLANINAFPLPPSPPYLFAGWSNCSFRYVATGNTTRLQFADEGFQVNGDPLNGNASPLLDNVRAQLAEHAIYRVSERRITIGDGQTSRMVTRGWMVLEPDTLRGTLIAGFIRNQQKRFTVIPMTNFRLDRVSGSLGVTNTILAKAESPGTQYAGAVLESIYAKGRNAAVTFGSTGPRLFPKAFTATGRFIFEGDGGSGTTATELTGTYALDVAGTQASNRANESFDAAVTRLTITLIAAGYLQLQ